MTAPEFDATSFVALAFKTKDGFGETVKFVPSDLHAATKSQLRKVVAALRDMVDHADEVSSPLIVARAVLAEIEKGGV